MLCSGTVLADAVRIGPRFLPRAHSAGVAAGDA